jgi:TonB family protein
VNKPAICARSSKSRVVIAFVLAAPLHVAVAIASQHDQVPGVAPIGGQPDVTAVDLIDPPATTTVPEPSSVPAPPEDRDSEFVEEYETKPVRHAKKRIAPVRHPAAGSSAPVALGTTRANALRAPRPGYPYECRRANITGSGVALMTIAADGSVTDAQMSQSTGNVALDQATLSALRCWRFKPGLYSVVRAPITFSLSGAQF